MMPSKGARQLDKADHNTLGALQFVAKMLQAWFMLIATGLVYDLSMIFAKQGDGGVFSYSFKVWKHWKSFKPGHRRFRTQRISQGELKCSNYIRSMFAAFVAS